MTRLPVTGAGKPRAAPRSNIARSKNAPRRAWVLLGVHVLIAGHIAYWLHTGSTISPIEPSEAIAFSTSGVVNAGLLFFAAMIVCTAVFGRFFCGWACHLVALQDGSRWLLEKLGRKPAPLRARLLGWVPTLAFLYLFIWPLARRLGAGDALFSGPTDLVTTEFWARFPGWALALLTFFICGFVAIYFLGAKGFCTYACPYGAAFAAVDRVAPLRIRVTDACEGCGHCTAVCTSNIRVHQEVRDFGMVTSPGCMKCMDCVSVCPKDALYYGKGPIPLLAKARRTERAPGPSNNKNFPLSLWEEVLLLAVGLAGIAIFRGLYGAVPILLALGLAAVFAYFAWLGFRLLSKPHVAFRGWQLKRGGTLTRSGAVASVLVALSAVFFLHSAWMRWTLQQAELGYQSLRHLRSIALDLEVPVQPLTEDERLALTVKRYQTLERAGLFSTFGTPARLAALYLMSGDAQKALASAERAIERGELAIDAAMVAGAASAKTGDLRSALAEYQRILRAAPEHLPARINAGLIEVEIGQTTQALRTFEEGLTLHPRSVELIYNAGLAALLENRTDRAIALFERALELDPNNQAALENLAGTLAQAGRFEAARERFEQAVSKWPDDIETRLLLARVLMELGEFAGAREQLGEVLVREPDHVEAQALWRELGGLGGGAG